MSVEGTGSRWPGRLQLILLVAGCVLPMLLASSMYRLQFWVPDSRTYHGQLFADGRQVGDLGVSAAAEPVLGEPGREARWQLLVTVPGACSAECRQLLYLARQIHTSLGRDALRASHALASDMVPEGDWLQDYPRLQRYALDLPRYRHALAAPEQAWLWIVDPHGNLVLRYDARVCGQNVLRDLQHLMRLSKIG